MKEIFLTVRIVVLSVGLFLMGVEDIRKKEIGSLPLLIMGGVGILLSLLSGEWTNWTVVFRFVPGCVILLLAWITRESIGYGDGLAILCLGCFLSGVQIVNICMIAITFAGVAALFLLLVRRRSRKTQIPFIPFLIIGFAVTELIGG